MEAEKRISLLLSIFLIISFCYSSSLRAESKEQIHNPLVIDSKKLAAALKSWSGEVDLSYSRSIAERSDSFYSEHLNLGLGLQRKLDRANTLSISSSFLQELDGLKEKNQGTTNVSLSHARPVFDAEDLNASVSVRAILPTNRESARHTSFQGGLLFGGGVTWARQDLSFGRQISAALNLGYRENFYTYDATRMGDLNLARMLTAGAGLRFVLSSLWSLDLGAGLTKRYDTTNAALDDVYSHSETIQYQPSKTLAFNFGHEIEDVATKYDRVTANVQAYDLAASRVFGAAKFMF